MLRTFASLAAFAAITFALSPDAHAKDLEGEVAVGAGFATGAGAITGPNFPLGPGAITSMNPYGLGVSLRGGVSFHDVYFGVRAIDWTGSHHGAETAVQLGGELGYSFRFLDGLLVLRPKVGLGVMTYGGAEDDVYIVNADGTPYVTNRIQFGSNLYVEPGALLTCSFGRGSAFFVGAEVDALLVPSVARENGTHAAVSSLALGLELGVRF